MQYPNLQPTVNNTFLIVEDWRCGNFTVKRGYETNGADIPRGLWSFVPPFKPKYLPAVVIHDYLCDKGEYKMADQMFELTLLSIEDSFKTRLMIKSVKFYTRWLR